RPPPPPREASPSWLALRRLDEHQLPPVEHLRDRTRLLDLRVRVAHRVMQGLDVDAGNLHARVLPRTLLPQTTTSHRYHGAVRVRAKCCGCTEAFQASRAGSIPVARSSGQGHTGSGAVW